MEKVRPERGLFFVSASVRIFSLTHCVSFPFKTQKVSMVSKVFAKTAWTRAFTARRDPPVFRLCQELFSVLRLIFVFVKQQQQHFFLFFDHFYVNLIWLLKDVKIFPLLLDFVKQQQQQNLTLFWHRRCQFYLSFSWRNDTPVSRYCQEAAAAKLKIFSLEKTPD